VTAAGVWWREDNARAMPAGASAVRLPEGKWTAGSELGLLRRIIESVLDRLSPTGGQDGG